MGELYTVEEVTEHLSSNDIRNIVSSHYDIEPNTTLSAELEYNIVGIKVVGVTWCEWYRILVPMMLWCQMIGVDWRRVEFG